MYPKDVRIPPGEEWYYELDGRSHGPLSRIDLDELLNCSGETASEARIRQGANGPWSPFQSDSSRPGITRAPASTPERTRESEQLVGHLPAQPPVSKTTVSESRGLLSRHWDVAAAIGAWVLLDVVLLCWPQSYARERGYLKTLRAIEADVQDLRSKPTSDAEWRRLAERTRATLAPIVMPSRNRPAPPSL